MSQFDTKSETQRILYSGLLQIYVKLAESLCNMEWIILALMLPLALANEPESTLVTDPFVADSIQQIDREAQASVDPSVLPEKSLVR